MSSPRSPSPIAFFFLVLPYGISNGFVLVTLPYVLTQSGLSVGEAATITALGLSASVWAFLWGPMVDLTLSLRRWYFVGVGTSAAMILLISTLPLRAGPLLTWIVFLEQVATTWISLPAVGLIAHTVAEQTKGRAAGWYQAGNLGGAGLGGGVGVWLASHASFQLASATVGAIMLACSAALWFVPDVRPIADQRLVERLREIGRNFRDMLTNPAALLVIALVTSPIGAGAASNLWSAVAGDWRASANVVAVYTGFLSGLVSATGCVLGGWLADRVGRWRAFFGAGAFMALVALVLSAAPRTPAAYASGVLTYALATGLAYAAYSTLVLFAVGRGAASTKYAILNSLGNVPVVYMTAFDGWAHDRWGASGMLWAEAALSAAAILVGIVAVWKLGATRAPASQTDSPTTLRS